MDITGNLDVSLTARGERACVEAALAAGIAQTGPTGRSHREADTASLGPAYTTATPGQWAAAWAEEVVDFTLGWNHEGRRPSGYYDWWGNISLSRPDTVKIQNTRYRFGSRSILDALASIPFSVAAAGCHDETWWRDRTRLRNSFSDGHFLHGWMAAFSGEDGHARIASRRWLQHGPWRVLRDEAHDTTMVQLYDLHADEETAWTQYAPAQDLLGFSLRGAFISLRTTFEYVKPRFFDRARQTSIVLVDDRDIDFDEIHDATAIKLLQPYPGIHVEQVAFVFLQEERARRWLPELWLRGLECRAITGGKEVVLTDGWEPPPAGPPDWVKRVQDREGT